MSENRYGQFDRQRIQENRKKTAGQTRQTGYARAIEKAPEDKETQRPVRNMPKTEKRMPVQARTPVKANNGKKQTKKKNKAFGVLSAIVVLAALAFLAWLVLPLLIKGDPGVQPTPTPYNYTATSGEGSVFVSLVNADPTDAPPEGQGNSISVTDLSVTEGLDETWLNVLLLGTDSRVLGEPARTDTMIICSINKVTGDVKLISIMRDTDVSFEGHESTRINNAFFYGGPNLSMKVVNETFGMNIQHYVYVDFSGFAQIAEAIGGVEMQITENEMKHINHNVMEQYHLLIKQGKMEYSVAEAEYYDTLLETYTTDGSPVHLNGMQTLGYARIRKLDSDYGRTERQRKVLNALMGKLQNASYTTLANMALTNAKYYATNLSLNQLVDFAQVVLSRTDFTQAQSMYLPVQGTYTEERRNNDARLYDVDKEANKIALHNFIYK
ncbi:MAG: LCP family protein [Clostridia bacterium]|nr:LCP family protein [Clostridia bacterium]